jgi:LacI family transcriptional regulator
MTNANRLSASGSGYPAGMPNAPVVTLQHVADLVGVHKSTVHRALRGDPRVEAGTTERIRAAAAQLGYDPAVNQGARQLSLRKTGKVESSQLIALLFPVVFTRGAYFQRLYVSFMEAISLARYDVLARIHESGDVRLPPSVVRGDVDALVVLNHPDELAAIHATLAAVPAPLRRPMVTLITATPGASNVTSDLRQGGRLAMAHLLDLGHRRIITIGNMAFRAEDRVAGCREELIARGLDPDRHLVVADSDKHIKDDHQRIAEVLDRLLAACPDATAMLAPQDHAAGQLVPMLAERGRPVPERMSLVGFDDTDPVPGPGGANLLTSVALPLEQLGRTAANLAMEAPAEPRTIVLPVSLRVRGTTRAPA